MFCHVGVEQVIGVHDMASVYHVPLLLEAQGVVTFLQKRLSLPSSSEMPLGDVERGISLHGRWKALTRG
jgi:CTP synthase